MQDKSKGVYVQMPKQEHDEAVKLLDELVEAINFGLLTDRDVTVLEILNANLSYQAKEYLKRKGVVIEKERGLSTNERVKYTLP